MATFRQSFAYVMTSKYLVMVTQLVSSMILARLLTPEDIGIYSVGVVFVGLGHIIREFGVAKYVIQEKELTDERAKAAFTLNLIMGWGVGLLLFAASPWIGQFYDSDAVREVVNLLCLNFLLIPFGAVTVAVIRRNMEFEKSMVISVASAVVSAGVGVATALMGQAYLSLVWSSIAGSAVTVLLSLWYRPAQMPFGLGFKEIPHVFQFTRYAGSYSLVAYIGHSSPDWILGKMLGMHAVGIFSRAMGTLSIFNKALMDSIHAVALPHFSRQEREHRFDKDKYLLLLDHITVVAWPFFAMLMVLGDPIIFVLFGDQWGEAVPVLQVLCVMAVFGFSTALFEEVMTAQGRVKLLFNLSVITQSARILAIVLGVFYGVVGAAIGICIVRCLRVLANHYLSARLLGITSSDKLPTLLRNGMLALVIAAIAQAAVTVAGMEILRSPLPLAAVGAVIGLVWLISVWLLRAPIREEIIAVANDLLARMRGPGSAA